MNFLGTALGNSRLLLQLFVWKIIMKRVRVNIFGGNLRPALSKLFPKKSDTFIIHCSSQALSYNIVYFDENCQLLAQPGSGILYL